MEVGITSKMSAKDILRTIVLCTPFMFQVSCIIPLLFFKGHDLVPILNLRSLGSSMSYQYQIGPLLLSRTSLERT